MTSVKVLVPQIQTMPQLCLGFGVTLVLLPGLENMLRMKLMQHWPCIYTYAGIGHCFHRGHPYYHSCIRNNGKQVTDGKQTI